MAKLNLIPKYDPELDEAPIYNFRLRRARIEKNLLIKDLTKKVRMTFPNYFKIESLRSCSNKKTRKKIAKVLNQDVEYLFPQIFKQYCRENRNEDGKVVSEDVFDRLNRVELNMEKLKEMPDPRDYDKMRDLTELDQRIMNVLCTLNYRERETLKLSFGLGEGFRYSFREIGKILNISGGRVGQIGQKAIGKLQGPVGLSYLKDFYELKKLED